jgi:hypothetical protein
MHPELKLSERNPDAIHKKLKSMIPAIKSLQKEAKEFLRFKHEVRKVLPVQSKEAHYSVKALNELTTWRKIFDLKQNFTDQYGKADLYREIEFYASEVKPVLEKIKRTFGQSNWTVHSVIEFIDNYVLQYKSEIR